jgi:hypothetical protein
MKDSGGKIKESMPAPGAKEAFKTDATMFFIVGKDDDVTLAN